MVAMTKAKRRERRAPLLTTPGCTVRRPRPGFGLVFFSALGHKGGIARMKTWPIALLLGAWLGTSPFASTCLAAEGALQLNLRSRTKTPGSEQFAVSEHRVAWEPKKTALIICDMWDDHWCKSAARRVGELAGPLNDAVKVARARGVFIIHAPSTCTGFYKATPQRKRARAAPFSQTPLPLATTERWGTA